MSDREIQTTVEEITPEMAACFLQNHNPKNRPLRPSTVEHYARQMKDGLWRLNGEPLIFDWEGNLLNGQHRFHASVQSRTPFISVVIRGVDPDAFGTLDLGVRRTAGDTLALVGERNAKNLAAAANLLWRYEQGIWHRGGGPYPTTDEIMDVIERHPGLRNSVAVTYSLDRLMPRRAAAVLHYLFSLHGPARVQSFFETLATGAEVTINDPVRILRERLIDNRRAKAKLPIIEILALTIKAWNHSLDGTNLRFLRWRNAGPDPEPFPTIERASGDAS